MMTDRRYQVHHRVVGHAWAQPQYRLKIGTVVQVFAFTPPPGYKAYCVEWMIDGQPVRGWHDERELSPLREDDE